MPRRRITEFASTTSGREFFRAYDIVAAKWPADTDSIMIDSAYGSTHVMVCGPADAPPVILLPGAGATSTPWFRTADELIGRRRVYALDIIGDVGRSVADGRPVRTVDDLMNWFRSVLDSLGVLRPAVIAHSYGAMIALSFALRQPGRIGKLVLVDPNSCFGGMRPQYLLHAIPIFLRPNERRERAFIKWETDGRQLDADWLTLLALGAEHFPKSKTIVPKRPTTRALSALTADTTVILAAKSKVHYSGQLKKTIDAKFRDINTVIIAGATHHTFPLTPAAELNAAISSALAT